MRTLEMVVPMPPMVVPMSAWFDFRKAEEMFGGMSDRIPKDCGIILRQIAIDEIKFYFLNELCAYLGLDPFPHPCLIDEAGATWTYNLKSNRFEARVEGVITTTDPLQFKLEPDSNE